MVRFLLGFLRLSLTDGPDYGIRACCGVSPAFSTLLKSFDTFCDQASKTGVFFSNSAAGTCLGCGHAGSVLTAQPVNKTASIISLNASKVCVLLKLRDSFLECSYHFVCRCPLNLAGRLLSCGPNPRQCLFRSRWRQRDSPP